MHFSLEGAALHQSSTFWEVAFSIGMLYLKFWMHFCKLDILSAGGVFWLVFFIANIAALIASRTMTTATFSCIKQSTTLGCFPRLKIIHTSRKFMGQIYIPVINWFLLVFAIVVVCCISGIDEMGNAYGTLLILFCVRVPVYSGVQFPTINFIRIFVYWKSSLGTKLHGEQLEIIWGLEKCLCMYWNIACLLQVAIIFVVESSSVLEVYMQVYVCQPCRVCVCV